LLAVAALAKRIAALVQVSEIRTIAADRLWLSPSFDRDSVAIHFTWVPDWPSVKAVLPIVEAALAPFEPRPHWGKLFTLAPSAVRDAYPRLDDFAALATRRDPGGKLRNAFLDRYLFTSV
jgi:alditol oxidase